jgi:site-specific DNA-methyltransferase (adenine-specific)
MTLPTEAEPVVVVEGDALDVLRGLPAGCVDAVVTDPPYGQTNEGYDGPGAVSLRPGVWAECARVCKPDAALLSFAGSPTYHRIASAVEAGGWKVRQMWGWVYRDGMITSAYPREGFDRLAPAMDPIVYATRGKVLLNVEREGEHEWDRVTGRSPATLNAPTTYSTKGNDSRAGMALTGRGRYPRAIVSDGAEPFAYFSLPRSGRYRESDHPNEKPAALMRWLVAKLPGAVILDPFGGSGTTGVAALAEGRRCLLVEKEPAYAAIARRRVAEAMGTGLLAPVPT